MTLLEETRARLDALPRGTTLTEVHKGCGVSIAWLSRFASGKMPNPGVIQVEKLCEYLRGISA